MMVMTDHSRVAERLLLRCFCGCVLLLLLIVHDPTLKVVIVIVDVV